MARVAKNKSKEMTITTTRDLRVSLIQTYQDLLTGRMTLMEARARAQVARAIMETVRTEIMMMRINNVDNARTINLTAESYKEVPKQ